MDLKNLSTDELLERLHRAVREFVSDISDAVTANRRASVDEIALLRNHLIGRLKEGRDVSDNKRLIDLLGLLSRDRLILEVVRDDSSEWLKALETIEERMSVRKPLSQKEREELESISRMTAELKGMVRKM